MKLIRRIIFIILILVTISHQKFQEINSKIKDIHDLDEYLNKENFFDDWEKFQKIKESLPENDIIKELKQTTFKSSKNFDMSYQEKIIRAGYLFEEYKVLTEDGYINTVWRIPGKKENKNLQGKKPIILQHGLIDDSWTFFAFEAKNCLPFILSDLGFDVWLPNTRGNIFSWEHIDPQKNSRLSFSEYWNFSLDEIAEYDFPSNVDFIRNKTGFDKVIYIGHSQGTIQFFMKFMRDPNFINESIEKFVAIGTVPFIFNTYSPIIVILARINIFKILNFLHLRNFLELGTFTSDVVHYICVKYGAMCKTLIEAIVETKITNRTDFKEISDLFFYEPGGTSIKNLLHWIQIYHKQTFTSYDYGTEKNIKIYGEPNPPQYDLEKFSDYKIPSLITRSDADPFSATKDIDLWLKYAKYEEKRDSIKVLELKNYNHLDYLWSLDAVSDIFSKVGEFIVSDK